MDPALIMCVSNMNKFQVTELTSMLNASIDVEGQIEKIYNSDNITFHRIANNLLKEKQVQIWIPVLFW